MEELVRDGDHFWKCINMREDKLGGWLDDAINLLD